jgi:geranylgeranyl diphosphate synthase type II
MANVRPTKELLKSFEDFMKSLDLKKAPYSLYLPVDYILSLGGKRIRPMTVLFVTELLEGNMDAAMQAAYGLELFHNFSLIHDDIMDQSELRRSRDSVHKKFGINAAILSGDVMMIDSMQFINKAEKLSGVATISDLFIQTAREVCEGQAMDMEFEKKIEISYDDYLEMIRLKTAVLLAFGLKTAALLSSRTDLADTFYDLGIYAGQAFQLEDDWLDFYATETAFGKIKAGDILQAKKSALILELMEQLDVKQKSEFAKWYQQEKNDEIRILKMNEYFETHEINSKLKERMKRYQNESFVCIEKMDLSTEQKSSLKNFIFGIFSRKI